MIDYDPHSWLDHLFDVRGSLVKDIMHRVLLCTLWAGAITVGHFWLLREYKLSLDISPTVHTLLGAALGMLLVFRTNASYERFWEGRKQWGSIINETRNLARVSSVVLSDAPALSRAIIIWTMAFPHSVMHRLRGTPCELGFASKLLSHAEQTAVTKAQHPSLAIACRLSAHIAAAKKQGLVQEVGQFALDQNVQLLIDYCGACERIHSTPLPFAYVVHLRRALILYTFSLPFALVGMFGWVTIPATLMIGFILAGIEEIGVEIEDPFGTDDNDLPLERFCETIEKNLTALLDPANETPKKEAE